MKEAGRRWNALPEKGQAEEEEHTRALMLIRGASSDDLRQAQSPSRHLSSDSVSV